MDIESLNVRGESLRRATLMLPGSTGKFSLRGPLESAVPLVDMAPEAAASLPAEEEEAEEPTETTEEETDA